MERLPQLGADPLEAVDPLTVQVVLPAGDVRYLARRNQPGNRKLERALDDPPGVARHPEEATMATDLALAADSGTATKTKLAIIMFSGTADKFLALGVLSQAAAALGTEVDLFVSGFALLGFTKEHHDLPFATEFAGMAGAMAQGLEKSRVAPWDTMVRQAKELGAKVHACSMMSGVMGLALGDFNDLIDDIVGAASFIQMAEGGQTLFI